MLNICSSLRVCTSKDLIWGFSKLRSWIWDYCITQGCHSNCPSNQCIQLDMLFWNQNGRTKSKLNWSKPKSNRNWNQPNKTGGLWFRLTFDLSRNHRTGGSIACSNNHFLYFFSFFNSTNTPPFLPILHHLFSQSRLFNILTLSKFILL